MAKTKRKPTKDQALKAMQNWADEASIERENQPALFRERLKHELEQISASPVGSAFVELV